ncbi:DUF721 domain-containing protein [Meiothermus sp. QL-1]|uniref:DUF721 domain-containing protein n=1 Tax=Meiothermus sp. QL-1 TaxID=2058095 RepID=UPI000E0A0368|nr:DUF721 domain-containing protein [Meiothermus sp. QL-1]RDI96362.1 DUF721 domain-containing protein [Meiothermus sp. QL-1]
MPSARSAAELVARILGRKELRAGVERGRAIALWPQVAGPALGQMSEAERLEDGVLFVRVTDSVVAHQLTYLREEFIRRYQEHLPGVIREVRFFVGGGKRPKPKAEPSSLPPLSPEEEARLQALVKGSPVELQPVLLRAGQAVLRRYKASPHGPCAVCGAPSPVHPCRACRRLLAEPVVRREAVRLSRFPLRPRLEGEPLEAARYLARKKLEAQLKELLPQAIRQPELIAILQDTARRYLQLCTGQQEVQAYRHLLPAELASLLKEI